MQNLDKFLKNEVAKNSLKRIFGGIGEDMLGYDPTTIIIYDEFGNPINGAGPIIPSGNGSIKYESTESGSMLGVIKLP